MIALLIVAIVLAVLALLVLCPLRVHLCYQDKEWQARLWVLFVPITLWPIKERPPKPPAKPKKQPPPDKPPPKKGKIKVTRAIAAGWRLLKGSAPIAKKLCRRLVFYQLRIDGKVGGPDAHTTALSYGKITAAVGVSLQLVQQLFSLKGYRVNVAPDFTAPHSHWQLSLKLRITPLALLIALIQLIAVYLKSQHHAKGGSHHESAASHQ